MSCISYSMILYNINPIHLSYICIKANYIILKYIIL